MTMVHADHDRSTNGDDRRRAELLEAAGRVFRRRPAGALTLAAVAEEAGVSRRLMYHYFADLQALYDEMFDARIVGFINRPDPEPRPTTVEAMVATAFRQFAELPPHHRRWMLMAGTDTLPAEQSAQRDLLFESMGARWADADFLAGLVPATRRTVLSMVIATICLLATAIDDGHLTVDQATDIAVTTIVTIGRTAHHTIHAAPLDDRS